MDSDKLASEKPADQDLHCFQTRIYLDQDSKDKCENNYQQVPKGSSIIDILAN